MNAIADRQAKQRVYIISRITVLRRRFRRFAAAAVVTLSATMFMWTVSEGWAITMGGLAAGLWALAQYSEGRADGLQSAIDQLVPRPFDG